MGYIKRSSKRAIHTDKYLTQKSIKVSNKQPNFTPHKTGERAKPKKLVEARK